MSLVCAEKAENRDGTSKTPRIAFLDADDGWETGGCPPLGENEVHLWRARLDREDRAGETGMLSEGERDKAGRFYFEKDRRRFAITHATLRKILGGYLQTDPCRVGFEYGPYGKPSVAGSGSRICFNMSDSRHLAVFAFMRGYPVGVDVEYVRPLEEIREIVSNFFSPGEKAVFQTIREDQKLSAFFACWTRKEAYLKALGKGLHQPLDSFEVSCEPGADARLVWVRDNSREVAKWCVRSFVPETGYAGAVVFQCEAGGG